MAHEAARDLSIHASAYRAIGKLRAVREYERRHLGCVRTVEDRDLLLRGIGSVATIKRYASLLPD